MKKRWIIYICITLFLLAASGIGIYGIMRNSSAISIEEALARYQNAIVAANAQTNIAMDITQSKETTINGEGFLETATQSLQFKDRGKSTFTGVVLEERAIGDHTITIEEAYKDNTGYFTVQGSKFCSDLTAEEYLDRYIPTILITPGLYNTITASVADSVTSITFTDGTAPESWIQENNASFLHAEGSVQLTADDRILQATYTITYSSHQTSICYSVTTKFDSADTVDLSDNIQTSDYTPIEYLDGPRILEIACGYILASGNITSDYNSKIFCEAFGDMRKELIQLNMADAGSWSARLDTDVTVTNAGRAGDISHLAKTELFADGTYTATTNGITSDTGSVNMETMKSWCSDILVGTIMLPQYLSGASSIASDKILHITYTANEDFVKLIGENTCQILYETPELLNQLSEAHTTDNLEAYLDLDTQTGWPLAAGIRYQGTYTINGIAYLLTAEFDQTYNVLSQTAYDAIHEKSGA